MDVGQVGRRVRAEAFHGSPQAARVLAARDLPPQPTEVRAHRQRGTQDREAAPYQSRRQSEDRPNVPRRLYG